MNAHQSPRAGASRSRGAPPGNQNARTHGFYSTALTPEEQQSLQKALDIRGLQPEIAVMRVKLLEILANPASPPELMILAARILTRMVDVQDRIIHGR